MTASYPASVKSFTNKTDNVDTVYAANVDDLQNEVNALERVVGTNPASWAGITYTYPPYLPGSGQRVPNAPYAAMNGSATYASVADRLNQLQAQVAWLTTVTGLASQPGPPQFRRPVSIIRCTGFPFLPGAANWQPFPWGATDYDPLGMFQGGVNIAAPSDGWWRVSLQVWSDVAVIAATHHANVRLIVNALEAGTDGSQVQYGVVDQHRMNLSWEGPVRAGQLIRTDFTHAPGDGNGSPVNARATISLSQLRDIS